MIIADKTILVTGPTAASGGRWSWKPCGEAPSGCTPGRASRWPTPMGASRPLTLDVTNAAQTQAAAGQVGSLDILVDNTGVGHYDHLSDRACSNSASPSTSSAPTGSPRPFLPLLTRSRGAIVNVLSVTALAVLPMIPAYKA
jgi:NAD(P)-dependent dehydrogenase (short-subunit alcohol dehydrogenase family)